jgi:site-specific DNA recombinase
MSAVIYARQSLDRDGEGTAVARQLTECHELAKRHKLTITREFIDNDVSASKGIRPAFTELLGEIRAGRIDTIVVWHTDRLYRRLGDLVDLVELAEKHALEIRTVRAGDLDLNNPAGRMMAQMLGAAARYEIEQKSARQVASNVQRAKAGVWHFAQRPFGYKRDGDKLIIVEEEAAVIRDIVGQYIAGASWYAIMKDLNARGITTQTGKKWSHENVRLRVVNPAYAGIRNYKGELATESGNWPPIIDRETWDRFENVLAARKPAQTWAKTLKYLGSGLYKCGKCGGRVTAGWQYVRGDGDNYPVYQCVKLDVRRRMDLVDEVVEREVIARLSLPGVVELLTPSEDEALLATRAKEIRERIDGLAALYADGIITVANLKEQQARLQEQLDEISRRLSSSQAGSVFAEIISADDIEKHWREKVSLRDKRSTIDALVTVEIMPVAKRGGSNTFDPNDVKITNR